MMDLQAAMTQSAMGMKAQGTRLRVISENMANANSTPEKAGLDPYRRKVVTFKNEFDRALGIETIKVAKVETDKGAFEKVFRPGHPSADKDGYVLMPNVNSIIEMADMKEASRSYQANLSMIELSKNMLMRTVDLLRA